MAQRILVFDSTIYNSLQGCDFYTLLNFVKNYRPRDVQNPLEKGDLGHIVAETFYKALMVGEEFEKALQFAGEAGMERWQSLNITLEEAQLVIHTFYSYARFNQYDGMKVLGVEEPFLIVLHEDAELKICYAGKTDLHAILPMYPAMPVDHKFRGRKNDELILNNQFIGYALAKNTNHCLVNEIGLQVSKTDSEKFRRMFLYFPDGFMERWKKTTIAWAKKLDENIQTNVWLQAFNNCKRFGKPCIFHKVCESDSEQEMKEQIMKLFYQGEPWDVTKVLEGEAEYIGPPE